MTGFLFCEPDPAGLIGAVRRAFDTFADGRLVSAMRRRAMAKPHQWQQSARRHSQIYEDLMPVAAPARLAVRNDVATA